MDRPAPAASGLYRGATHRVEQQPPHRRCFP